MQDAFITFAHTGDPSTAELPAWPRHAPDELAFMIFDAQCRVSTDFVGAERRAAWASVPLTAV